MGRKTIRLKKKKDPNAFAEMLGAALDKARPDDAVVYWVGPSGGTPRHIIWAAQAMESGGRCQLAQRLIVKHTEPRIWEYLAIKAKTMKEKA